MSWFNNRYIYKDITEGIYMLVQRLSQTANAAIIGQVDAEPSGLVLMQTELGAERILGILEGEHVPRIC